jgi:hypothetical protein
MTQQYSVANFTRFHGATESPGATGATGTRTFTPASSVPYVGVTFAILPASGGGGVTVTPLPIVAPSPAAIRASTW